MKKMPIKPIIFEWTNLTSDITGAITWTTNQTTARYPISLTALREYDIFNGNFGIRLNRPAQLLGNEFMVINKIACSPFAGSHIQILLEGTKYFLNPDGQFTLDPPIYILPGQQFSALYTSLDGITGVNDGGSTAVGAIIHYTLFDGIDAMIARKVMEMGLSVNAKNCEWYKREILKLSKEQTERVGVNRNGNIPYY